jgi:hypothetical protein
MTISSSTSIASNMRKPSENKAKKGKIREEDQRWERHPISIVFGQIIMISYFEKGLFW